MAHALKVRDQMAPATRAEIDSTVGPPVRRIRDSSGPERGQDGRLSGSADASTSRDNVRVLTRAEVKQRRVAARKHGLRSTSLPKDLRSRTRRAEEQLYRLLDVLVEEGRPLRTSELPAARQWARLDVIATLLYAGLIKQQHEQGTWNDGLLDRFLTVSGKLDRASASLGLTPATRALLRGDAVERQADAEQAAAELRRLYGRGAS
jgi:hypothetical protein